MVTRAKIAVLDHESLDRQLLYDWGIIRDTDFRQIPTLNSKPTIRNTEIQRGYKDFDPDEFNK